MNPIGCNSQQLTNLLSCCECQEITLGDEKNIFFNEQQKQKKVVKFDKKDKKKIIKKNNKETPKRKEKKIDPNSPFAVLQKLL